MTPLLPNEPLHWASLPQETLNALRERRRQREAQEQREREAKEKREQREKEQLQRRQADAQLKEQKKAAFDASKPQPQPLNDFTSTSPDLTTASPDIPSTSPDVPSKSHDLPPTSQNPPAAKKIRHLNLPQVPASQQTYLEMEIDLQHHHQGRYPIEELSAADRKALYNLLQDHSIYDVANILPLAPPSGFNILVSPRSLAHFKRRYAATIHAHERAEALKNAHDIIAGAAQNADAFTQAAEHLLKLRLYQTTSDPSSKPEDLARLYKIQRDLRRQTLAERKQTHAEQKTKTS